MPKVSTGFTTFLTFVTSDFSGNTTSLQSSIKVELLEISPNLWNFESLETTQLSSQNARSYIPSDLFDPGTISATYHFDPSVDPSPATGVQSHVITWPDGTTYTVDGFMTSFAPTANFDIMTTTMEIKLTGDIVKGS